jgi:hypothetical protein
MPYVAVPSPPGAALIRSPAVAHAGERQPVRAQVAERVRKGVREIVFSMWFEGVATGECSLEKALREVRGPCNLLNELERNAVFGQFAMLAQDAAARAPKRRPLRGKPTAWLKWNRALVEIVAEHEGLPMNDPRNPYGLESLYARVAEIWKEHGVSVTAAGVKDSYYSKNKRQRLRKHSRKRR